MIINISKAAKQWREKAEAAGAIFVCALFEERAEKKLVKVYMPSTGDPCLTLLQGHKIITPTDEDLTDVNPPLEIDPHYRRTVVLQGGIRIGVNYYVDPAWRGSNVLANVEVLEKTDLFRKGEKMLSINIHQILPNGEPIRPEYELKIGVDQGDVEHGDVKIPNSEKFVAFKKIEPRKPREKSEPQSSETVAAE